VVGERWTALILRELLNGTSRYADFQAHLAGISPNILSTRLKHLEAAGVVHR